MLSRADGIAWKMFHGGLTSECQLLALNYSDSLCGLLHDIECYMCLL